MIKNFLNIKKILFLTFIAFLSGMISFIGYLGCNGSINILLLVYSYIHPIFAVVALGGQLLCILLCNKYFFHFNFLQNNFNSTGVIGIIIFQMFIIFMYSLFFKKILNTFSFKSIIRLFVVICFATLILQFATLLFFGIVDSIPPYIKAKGMNAQIGFVKNILPTLYRDIMKFKFANFTQLVLASSRIGLGSMSININLFIYSSISSIFLAIIGKDITSERFFKFDRCDVRVSNHYKIFIIAIGVLTLLLWCFQLHYFTLISFSFFFGLLFMFFLVGRDLLIDLFYAFTNSFLIIGIGIFLCWKLIPMFAAMLIILGVIDTFFNLRNR
jgi:hypothetical protein